MMKFESQSYNGGIDAIWRGEAKILPAGFMPDADLPSKAVVYRGTPVVVDMDNFKCTIAKSATIIEGGDSTNLRVAKGGLFVVGDEVTNGSAKASITAIDTSNNDYDVITVSAEISGDVIYIDCKPNAVVGANYINDGLGEQVLDIAYNCLVLYEATAQPIVDAWKDGINLIGNPSIKLIKQ